MLKPLIYIVTTGLERLLEVTRTFLTVGEYDTYH